MLNLTIASPFASHREPTTHELVNMAVADLRVICVGVENGRVFFEPLPGAEADLDKLAQQIVQRLARAPEPVHSALSAIKSVSITQK